LDLIFSLAKSRTVVFITHHITTIERADRIYFLQDGKIQEQGTHDELLAARGAYYRFMQISFSFLGEDAEKMLVPDPERRARRERERSETLSMIKRPQNIPAVLRQPTIARSVQFAESGYDMPGRAGRSRSRLASPRGPLKKDANLRLSSIKGKGKQRDDEPLQEGMEMTQLPDAVPPTLLASPRPLDDDDDNRVQPTRAWRPAVMQYRGSLGGAALADAITMFDVPAGRSRRNTFVDDDLQYAADMDYFADSDATQLYAGQLHAHPHPIDPDVMPHLNNNAPIQPRRGRAMSLVTTDDDLIL